MKNYDPLSFVTGEKQEAPCAWKTPGSDDAYRTRNCTEKLSLH